MIFFALLSSIAWASDEQLLPLMTEEKGFLQTVMDGSFLTKLVVFMLAIQLVLYSLGEALTRVSVMTENKWDNKAAKYISNAAWILGLAISKFGYSVPKLVIEEKAKKLESKGD
jgi:hypothetical protein